MFTLIATFALLDTIVDSRQTKKNQVDQDLRPLYTTTTCRTHVQRMTSEEDTRPNGHLAREVRVPWTPVTHITRQDRSMWQMTWPNTSYLPSEPKQGSSCNDRSNAVVLNIQNSRNSGLTPVQWRVGHGPENVSSWHALVSTNCSSRQFVSRLSAIEYWWFTV